MGQAFRRIQRRKRALQTLDRIMNSVEHVIVIHYSCESFYDRPDGSSPRVTSIAVATLESAQTRSFSIHQMAERQGVPLSDIEKHYDELEKHMLDEFYDYVKTHSELVWMHWNMRSINYGFQAIAHRYKVLGGEPIDIRDSNLVDLARLLHAIYGPHYASHPRLQNLVQLNEIGDKDFLPGVEEARAFENKEYVKLHFSTLRKVDILANIAQRADEGVLKTRASWRDLAAAYPQALVEWLNEHWLVQIVEGIFAIVGFIAAVVQLLQLRH